MQKILEQVNNIPKRVSLVDETVSALKASIRQGELTGEMQLKGRLRIGRDTLRRALKVLTLQGWILPATQGRRRVVRIVSSSCKNKQGGNKLPVTFLSPPLGQRQNACLEIEETQQQLHKNGVELRFITPEIFKLSQPQSRVQELVSKYPSSGWILHHASQPIQEWFAKQHLPALLYDVPFAGVDLPFIADDWDAAAFHAGIKLIRCGHRHIGILESNQRNSKSLAAERGLKCALETVNAAKQMRTLYADDSPT